MRFIMSRGNNAVVLCARGIYLCFLCHICRGCGRKLCGVKQRASGRREQARVSTPLWSRRSAQTFAFGNDSRVDFDEWENAFFDMESKGEEIAALLQGSPKLAAIHTNLGMLAAVRWARDETGIQLFIPSLVRPHL